MKLIANLVSRKALTLKIRQHSIYMKVLGLDYLQGTLHRKIKLRSNESIPVVNITRRILHPKSAPLVRSSFVKFCFRRHFLPFPPLWCDVTGVKVDFTAIIRRDNVNNFIYVVKITSLVPQLVSIMPYCMVFGCNNDSKARHWTKINDWILQ